MIIAEEEQMIDFLLKQRFLIELFQ